MVGIGVETFMLTGQIAFTQHQSRGPKKRALRTLRQTPIRWRHYLLTNLPIARLWHWKVIRDTWMGSALWVGVKHQFVQHCGSVVWSTCNILGV